MSGQLYTVNSQCKKFFTLQDDQLGSMSFAHSVFTPNNTSVELRDLSSGKYLLKLKGKEVECNMNVHFKSLILNKTVLRDGKSC